MDIFEMHFQLEWEKRDGAARSIPLDVKMQLRKIAGDGLIGGAIPGGIAVRIYDNNALYVTDCQYRNFKILKYFFRIDSS